MGLERLVGGAAARAPARHPGHRYRTRRGRHRTYRPHHRPDVKAGTEQFYAQLAITADDVAEVIAFAVTRPRRMTLNEILLRPTSQPG
jgi:NADP-dependent 3-hydroxy acid dehydrogenase YdfG